MSNIHLCGGTLSSCVDAQHGRVHLENCTARSCVKGRDGVVVKGGSCAGAVCSTMGRVSLEDTRCDAVTGRDGVKLVNATTSWVESTMGTVSISGGGCGSVSGRDGVHVNGATVAGVQSSTGCVSLQDSRAADVCGQTVTLTNTTAGRVDARKGDVSMSGGQCRDVSGRDGVKITGAIVADVRSSLGCVYMQGSHAADVKGRDAVTLVNTTAGRVKSSLGAVSIVGGQCGAVSGRDGVDAVGAALGAVKSSMGDITLSGVRVAGDVAAAMGAVCAKDCTLRGVTGRARITLTDTTATDVVLVIPAHNPHGHLSVSGAVQRVRVEVWAPQQPRLTVHVSGRECIRDGIVFYDCEGDIVDE